MESNIEIIKKAEKLSHQIITLDLTIRTLEVDKSKLSILKVNKPLIKWYEKQITELQNELIGLKKELTNKGGKINLKPEKDGDNIQIYSLLFRGSVYQYRYMSIVLRNNVENELSKRLGVTYVQNLYEDE